MDEAIIDNAQEFVRKVFEKDYSGHDYFHTLRVYNMAARIADQENADMMAVQLAALLHDVDDIKLSPETHKNKDRAVGFLKEHDVPKESVCRMLTGWMPWGLSVLPEHLHMAGIIIE